jgi:gas vesicle protein
MMDNTGTRMGGHLAAFAIGAAVGAGIALLYAPYSGEETRQLLARRSRDMKNRVAGAVEATKNRVTGAMEATKDAIRDQWPSQTTPV